MKRKPRWTLEMLTASLAVLCGLLLLALLVQRPMAWPLLAVLVVLLHQLLLMGRPVAAAQQTDEALPRPAGTDVQMPQ